MVNKEKLIARIEELCKEKEISANIAFCESGVGKNFKSNLNYAEPTLGKLSLLSNYFGVSVEYLLGETDERAPKEKSPAGAELSEKDRKLVDAYHKSEPVIQATVDRILGIEEKVYTVKVAARNGGAVTEKTLTEEEYKRLMSLPDVEDI